LNFWKKNRILYVIQSEFLYLLQEKKCYKICILIFHGDTKGDTGLLGHTVIVNDGIKIKSLILIFVT